MLFLKKHEHVSDFYLNSLPNPSNSFDHSEAGCGEGLVETSKTLSFGRDHRVTGLKVIVSHTYAVWVAAGSCLGRVLRFFSCESRPVWRSI